VDLGERTVESAMQRAVVSVGARERLDLVDDVMKLGEVRHMPVLEGERLVGVISQRDLLAASLSKVLEFEGKERRTFMRSVEVGEVMTPSPVVIAPSATLREAARAMLERRIGCLPVVDAGGRMVGLLTETDLMRAAYG
jgi:CBS domain-containing protein